MQDCVFASSLRIAYIAQQALARVQVVGQLAEKRPATEQALQGLLVRHGVQDSLMHPSDLPYFTKLHPGRVLQRQLLALQKPFSEASIPPKFASCCLYHFHACMFCFDCCRDQKLCCSPDQIQGMFCNIVSSTH